MDCVFCKIINGELPSYKIYEDEHTYAFLDIAKDVDGHTIVIPKKHITNVMDCDTETISKVADAIRLISKHYVEDLGYDGVNILNASGKAAEQSVFHLHFHIIPRKENDGLHAWPVFLGTKHSLEDMHKFLKLN
ncbi:MAG: HIT family protein [Roseburia sp.]|nr:HIT family protein [Anaeroplasma bactoclasticum]MCM1196006.1 HIT family protein [Roseburia sp.]MCM1556836.1 HIT family protein [Anaeroplasma bactoclasticum]